MACFSCNIPPHHLSLVYIVFRKLAELYHYFLFFWPNVLVFLYIYSECSEVFVKGTYHMSYTTHYGYIPFVCQNEGTYFSSTMFQIRVFQLWKYSFFKIVAV